MKFKRSLYLTHRWLGILMCLFFLMWFISGVVMMYVAFPALTPKERLAGLPKLQKDAVSIGPHALIRRVGESNIDSLRLTSVLTRPAYLIQSKDGQFIGMFADTGETIPKITSYLSLQAAQNFYFHSQQKLDTNTFTKELPYKLFAVEENVRVDQWTVSSSLHPHRPLYKVILNDSKGTLIYTSHHRAVKLSEIQQKMSASGTGLVLICTGSIQCNYVSMLQLGIGLLLYYPLWV